MVRYLLYPYTARLYIHPKNNDKSNLILSIMDVLNQIVNQSAIGPLNQWVRRFIISLFLAIVLTLLTMLAALLIYGQQFQFSFGY